MALSNRRRMMAITPALCVLAVAGASSAGVFAQSGDPNKPVKIVVPYPPGGAVDVVTRKMAQKLTEQMGQSFVIAGKLRLLAVSGDKRLAALPEVPTFAEAGVKNFGVVNWTGLWALKGTPPEVLARLQAEITKAMATPDMRAFAEGLGGDPRMADAPTFRKTPSDSSALWGRIAANTAFDNQ